MNTLPFALGAEGCEGGLQTAHTHGDEKRLDEWMAEVSEPR
jgi:hypothetical protein